LHGEKLNIEQLILISVVAVQVVYFTTTFPYLVMTILLIRSALLEGSLLGIKYYLTPDWNRLKDAKVKDTYYTYESELYFAISHKAKFAFGLL